MNPLRRILAAGLLLAAAHAFAADAFEGQVSFTITGSKGRPMEMDYTMKGTSLRMDMNADGKEVTQIIDMKKREMLMLMHEQHMYMVMPMPGGLPGAGKAPEGAPHPDAGPGPDVEKTGKTETILGYKCQQVLVKDKNKVTELWLADGLGMFMGMGGGNPMMGGGGPRGGGASKWEAALKGLGGFPLRVISHEAAGKETFKMEATRITPGPQPDSEFAPPDGYQKFSMPNMGGMMPPRG